MAKFTDKQGRDWTLELNYKSVKACRTAGYDPVNVHTNDEQKNAMALMDDPIYVADVLYRGDYIHLDMDLKP